MSCQPAPSRSWLAALPLPVTDLDGVAQLAGALTNRERSRAFHRGEQGYSLDAMQQLYRQLGSPFAGRPLVHVAGSKGKGSVCLLLESLLSVQGLRAGATLSPHLESWTERIRLRGRPVSAARMGRLLTAVLRRADLPAAPSFFETFTAAALLGFAEDECDAAVVEVGIGGRLDATNVVRSDVALVTSIECEHVAILGRRLCDIAQEKAGILKPPAWGIGGLSPRHAAAATLREQARHQGLRWWEWGRQIRMRHLRETFSLKLPLLALRLPVPAGGPFAARNAALAVAALAALSQVRPELGISLQQEPLAEGLVRAVLPGRCERLEDRPALYRDGAHTPCSLGAVVRWLARLHGCRPVLILGLQQDKRMKACLRAVRPLVGPLIATEVPGGRSRSAGELVESARGLGLPAESRPDLSSALQAARRLAGPDGVVLVSGSFWLAGEVRAACQVSG